MGRLFHALFRDIIIGFQASSFLKNLTRTWLVLHTTLPLKYGICEVLCHCIQSQNLKIMTKKYSALIGTQSISLAEEKIQNYTFIIHQVIETDFGF